jgi:hypothetical protein
MSAGGSSICMTYRGLSQVELHQPPADKIFLTIYFGSHKIPAALCFLLRAADSAIRSVVTGVWLGVLTPGMMRKLDHWYYTHGDPMYRSEDYNKSGLFGWEQDVIGTYFSDAHTVLVAAGAGAGRETLALHRKGIEVDGFEYNPALVELGNALLSDEGCAASIRPAPANAVPPGSNQYDGIIIGWAAYTLIAGRSSRIALLEQVRARCAAGAPILLSFFHRHGDTTFYKVSAAIANSIRLVLRRSRLEIGDTLPVYFAHRFTEQEIAEELTAAGFRPVLFRTTPYAHAVGIAV